MPDRYSRGISRPNHRADDLSGDVRWCGRSKPRARLASKKLACTRNFWNHPCGACRKRARSARLPTALAGMPPMTRLNPGRSAVLRRLPEGMQQRDCRATPRSAKNRKGPIRNILSKLGATDRTHAAMIGLKRGIIEFFVHSKSVSRVPFGVFGWRWEILSRLFCDDFFSTFAHGWPRSRLVLMRLAVGMALVRSKNYRAAE